MSVWAALATSKVRRTGTAAVWPAEPAWLASIVHDPAPTKVIVAVAVARSSPSRPGVRPETVHTCDVSDSSTTGDVEAPPIADTSTGSSPYVRSARAAKSRVCGCPTTSTNPRTCEAATYRSSPSWSAVRAQNPIPTRVTVNVVRACPSTRPDDASDTSHTLGEVLATTTGVCAPPPSA